MNVLTKSLNTKVISLLAFFVLSLNMPLFAQETTKTSKKVIITTKKVDKNGKETIEKIVKEGTDLDDAMIEKLIAEAKKGAKEVEVKIEEEETKKSSKTSKMKIVNEGEDVEEKLKEMGIKLPILGKPVANYVHAVTSNNWVFLAGKGPTKDDGKYIVGKLGKDLTIEQGYEAARWTGINLLAALKGEIGDLNRVTRIVKVKGMVNATPDFVDHSKVINGFSDLMVAVFGDKGKHARAAVGMSSLPGNMAVEIEVVVEIEE
jgi:enamine deaminase RidA (YjgF/YER057c/UK114 family)